MRAQKTRRRAGLGRAVLQTESTKALRPGQPRDFDFPIESLQPALPTSRELRPEDATLLHWLGLPAKPEWRLRRRQSVEGGRGPYSHRVPLRRAATARIRVWRCGRLTMREAYRGCRVQRSPAGP